MKKLETGFLQEDDPHGLGHHNHCLVPLDDLDFIPHNQRHPLYPLSDVLLDRTVAQSLHTHQVSLLLDQVSCLPIFLVLLGCIQHFIEPRVLNHLPAYVQIDAGNNLVVGVGHSLFALWTPHWFS